MLAYTSGTTGDSKGVKVTHWGIISSALIFQEDAGFTDQDCVMNYLPAPHVFDQFVTVAEMLSGAHHGYYQGSPLKLVEDCGVLQPTIFPSVPRLFNKIYAKILAGFDAQTGCKRWLVDKALASKSHYLTGGNVASYNSPCYDFLVFGKVAKLLGGRVRM